MYSEDTVAAALAQFAQGATFTEIARELGISRTTARDWVAGRVPRNRLPEKLRWEDLPARYAYLLGLYLGDGCLSVHPRDVFKLRITLDARYPGILDECEAAMRAVRPQSRVSRVHRGDCRAVEVYSYSKAWPTLFPQHGRGKKHLRRISLEDWQMVLVNRWPRLLLRGLIQSDGCRFMNTGRNWRHPRYSFRNLSPDIRRIFCDVCDELGVRWTTAPNTIYVSRVADVARLDEFIGPKT